MTARDGQIAREWYPATKFSKLNIDSTREAALWQATPSTTTIKINRWSNTTRINNVLVARAIEPLTLQVVLWSNISYCVLPGTSRVSIHSSRSCVFCLRQMPMIDLPHTPFLKFGYIDVSALLACE